VIRYEQDGVRVYQGDVLSLLPALDAGSARCCVTSPPYFRLRDYDCPATCWPAISYTPMVGSQPIWVDEMECGLGEETTLEAYTAHMIHVFREVWRVLSADGTLWLNLGDTFADDSKWGGATGGKHASGLKGTGGIGRRKVKTGLPRKSLCGVPWRVAFALQADGWFLRMDNIWHKTNVMPESVDDRPTKAHEYFFLLAKSADYFYDKSAVAEPSSGWKGGTFSAERDVVRHPSTSRKEREAQKKPQSSRSQRRRADELWKQAGLTPAHLEAIRACGITDGGKTLQTQTGAGCNTVEMQLLAAQAKEVLGGYYREFLVDETRNPRSVWNVGVTRYSDAHFATFSPKLLHIPILAGSARGDCVLDPFAGSGTTLEVARNMGRRAVGLELNPSYVDLSINRLGPPHLFGDQIPTWY
jgi:DNA modification methylase